jgi:toxin ParE1/3/4
MRKLYRVARSAERDLDAIWCYVARDAGEETASKSVDEIVERFRHLAQFPLSGRSRNDIEYGVRSLPVGEFIIYYRPRVKAGVLISRVIHGARRQKRAWTTDK